MNLKELLENIYSDKGEKINKLILNGQVTVEEIESFAINSGSGSLIYDVARFVKGVNIDALEAAVLEINEPKYLYIFARDINGAHIDKLLEKILLSDKSQFIYYFLMDVKHLTKDDKDKLVYRLMELKELFYIYSLALFMEHAPKEDLARIVLESNDPHYMSLFVKNIGVLVDEFLSALYSLGTEESYLYIKILYNEIEDINIKNKISALEMTHKGDIDRLEFYKESFDKLEPSEIKTGR